jgi:hypothetical protein
MIGAETPRRIDHTSPQFGPSRWRVGRNIRDPDAQPRLARQCRMIGAGAKQDCDNTNGDPHSYLLKLGKPVPWRGIALAWVTSMDRGG